MPDLQFEIQMLKSAQGNICSYLVRLPLLFQPGNGWRYSSTGFILLEYLLEQVIGLSCCAGETLCPYAPCL